MKNYYVSKYPATNPYLDKSILLTANEVSEFLGVCMVTFHRLKKLLPKEKYKNTFYYYIEDLVPIRDEIQREKLLKLKEIALRRAKKKEAYACLQKKRREEVRKLREEEAAEERRDAVRGVVNWKRRDTHLTKFDLF